jgi:hypothetical protein
LQTASVRARQRVIHFIPKIQLKYLTRDISNGPVSYKLVNEVKEKEEIEMTYESYKKDHPLIKSMRVLPKNYKVNIISPEIIVID